MCGSPGSQYARTHRSRAPYERLVPSLVLPDVGGLRPCVGGGIVKPVVVVVGLLRGVRGCGDVGM